MRALNTRIQRAGRLGVLGVMTAALLVLAACGGTTTTSPSPSATHAASPTPTGSPAPLPAPTVAGVIAFQNIRQVGTWMRPETSGIAVLRSDGAGLKRLTDGREREPAWSPNGARIAYVGDVGLEGWGEESQSVLWVMKADGSGQRPLTKQSDAKPVQDVRPAWSPDGSQIVFARTTFIPGVDDDGAQTLSRESQLLYVINADGSGLRRVTQTPVADTSIEYNPSWSPDGRILFLRGDVEGVWSVRPDGSDLAPLTEIEGIYAFAISPDGTRLAIVNNPEDAIQVVALDGSVAPVTVLASVTNLVRAGTAAIGLSWAPDGTALALAGNSRIYVVNADGSGLSAVPGIKRANAPAWRPR